MTSNLTTNLSLTPVKDRFQFGPWELLLMRICFAVLVFFAIKWEVGKLGEADPKKLSGLAHFHDFAWLPAMKDSIGVWKGVTIAGLAFYVVGILPILGLLPATFFAISIGTLANSQGAANHSTQLVSMILLGQFLVYALPWHRDAPLSKRSWLWPDLPVQQRMAFVSLVVFAACYVTAGYVKLQNSDWEWFSRIPGLAVDLQKTNWNAYYDTLAPVPASLETVVNLMAKHPLLAKILFGSGLVLELVGFIAVFGRRWAFFYGVAVIILHLSISKLMQLNFDYHMAAAVIFLINIPGLAKTFRKRDPILG